MNEQFSQAMSMLTPMLLMRDGMDNNIYHRVLNILVMVFIVPLLTKIAKVCIDTLSNPSKYWNREDGNKHIIKATIFESTEGKSTSITVSFRAVLNNLYKKLINDINTNIKYTVEEHMLSGTRSIKMIVFNSNRYRYKLTEDITIQTRISKYNVKTDKGEQNVVDYDLILYSNNMNNIKSYVDNVVKEYDRDIQTPDSLKIFLLKTINREEYIFDEIDFNTGKSFDNIFFKDKDKIINKLNYFMRSELEYKRLGIPYTLGMMFHGKPGTGKTSAIKAIANYTKRHIVILPVKYINTIDKLRSIFLSERINDLLIPFSQRLYVFEEIDCSQWYDIILSRDLKNKKDNSESEDSEEGELELSQDKSGDDVDNIKTLEKKPSLSSLLAINKLMKIKKKEKKEEEERITLGELLELLDGVIEQPGRMIIMTSNHPEKIDAALLRPGRIDLNICFESMSKKDINSMYKLWFDKYIPKEVYEKMEDYVFTQSDIGYMFSGNTLEDINNILVSNK